MCFLIPESWMHEVYDTVISSELSFKVQIKCFFLLPNFKEQQKLGRSPFTIS